MANLKTIFMFYKYCMFLGIKFIHAVFVVIGLLHTMGQLPAGLLHLRGFKGKGLNRSGQKCNS